MAPVTFRLRTALGVVLAIGALLGIAGRSWRATHLGWREAQSLEAAEHTLVGELIIPGAYSINREVHLARVGRGDPVPPAGPLGHRTEIACGPAGDYRGGMSLEPVQGDTFRLRVQYRWTFARSSGGLDESVLVTLGEPADISFPGGERVVVRWRRAGDPIPRKK